MKYRRLLSLLVDSSLPSDWDIRLNSYILVKYAFKFYSLNYDEAPGSDLVSIFISKPFYNILIFNSLVMTNNRWSEIFR